VRLEETKPSTSKQETSLVAKAVNKRINRLVILKFLEEFKMNIFRDTCTVYDGKSILYSSHPIASIEALGGKEFKKAINVDIDGRTDRFGVSIKATQSVVFAGLDFMKSCPQSVLQVIDIIMRYGGALNKIPIGFKVYYPLSQAWPRQNLGDNKELVQGYYQSARDSESGLLLNVNQVFTVFHKGGSLLEIFKTLLNVNDQQLRNGDYSKPAFYNYANEIKGLFMQVSHLPFKGRYKITGVSNIGANKVTFILKEESLKISVEEYYRRYRDKYLEFPNLPCIITGTKEFEKFWPLEFCELISDQRNMRKLKDSLLAQMVRSCAIVPAYRKQKIERTVQSIAKEGQFYLHSFGLELEQRMIELTGRILQHPVLYAGERIEPLIDGTWRIRNKLQSPKILHTWGIVCYEYRPDVNLIKTFCVKLKDQLIRFGCQVQDPSFFWTKNYSFGEVQKAFQESIKSTMKHNRKPQLIIFIISKRQFGAYQEIKITGDVQCGIITQCLSYDNFRSRKVLSPAFLQNVCYKINAKLGGVNTSFANFPLTRQNLMIVGVDVTHPSPTNDIKHSIAACVSSYDDTFALYHAAIKIQSKPTEEIVNLDIMIRDLLASYQKHNNEYPSKIIFYRDGVSEGQFEEVMSKEVSQLHNLFQELNIAPQVTFIVVQKRHNTRFFPKYERDAGSKGNVKAGLAVSSVITSSVYFDFYINSHDSFQVSKLFASIGMLKLI